MVRKKSRAATKQNAEHEPYLAGMKEISAHETAAGS
jgi:hypothetical protein